MAHILYCSFTYHVYLWYTIRITVETLLSFTTKNNVYQFSTESTYFKKCENLPRNEWPTVNSFQSFIQILVSEWVDLPLSIIWWKIFLLARKCQLAGNVVNAEINQTFLMKECLQRNVLTLKRKHSNTHKHKS